MSKMCKVNVMILHVLKCQCVIPKLVGRTALVPDMSRKRLLSVSNSLAQIGGFMFRVRYRPHLERNNLCKCIWKNIINTL